MRILLALVTVAAGVVGCSGKTKGNNESKTVKIFIEKSSAKTSLRLTDFSPAFAGLGIRSGATAVKSYSLQVGENTIELPLGTYSFASTLLAYDPADVSKVLYATNTTTENITPDTTEITLTFPNAEVRPMRKMYGVLYEADNRPAQNTAFAITDPHSGAAVVLPGASEIGRTDSRGVYTFSYYYSTNTKPNNVHLKVMSPLSGEKVIVLNGDAEPQNGWTALPFANLTGSTQVSPFAIDLNLLRGPEGPAGYNSVVTSAPFSGVAGACANGGVEIKTCIDSGLNGGVANNGACDGGEVVTVSRICTPVNPSGGGTKGLYVGTTRVGDLWTIGQPLVGIGGDYLAVQNHPMAPTTFFATPQSTSFEGANCSTTPFVEMPSNTIAASSTMYWAFDSSASGATGLLKRVNSRYGRNDSDHNFLGGAPGELSCYAVSSYLGGVASAGNNVVVAAGGGASVGSMSSGGITWTESSGDLQPEFHNIFSWGGNVLVATPQSGGPVLKSVNGGATWSAFTWPSGLPMPMGMGTGANTKFVANSAGTTILAVVTSYSTSSSSSQIYRSADSGATWSQPVLPASMSTYAYAAGQPYFDADSGHAGWVWMPTNSGLLVSKDSGANFARVGAWGKQIALSDSDQTILRFPGSCVTCGTATIYRSTDGGLSFAEHTVSVSFGGEIRGIAANGSNVVAYGSTAMIVSTNGGATWAEKALNPTTQFSANGISSMAIADNGNVYAVANGVASGSQLWYSTLTGTTWTKANVLGTSVNYSAQSVATIADAAFVMGSDPNNSNAAFLRKATDPAGVWADAWSGIPQSFEQMTACGGTKLCFSSYSDYTILDTTNVASPEVGQWATAFGVSVVPSGYRFLYANGKILGINSSGSVREHAVTLSWTQFADSGDVGTCSVYSDGFPIISFSKLNYFFSSTCGTQELRIRKNSETSGSQAIGAPNMYGGESLATRLSSKLLVASGASVSSSTDHGLSWTTTSVSPSASSYAIFGGKLVAIDYAYSNPSASFRVSSDGGGSWGAPIVANALPSSNSGSESRYNGIVVTNSRIFVNFGKSFAISNDTTTGAISSFTSQSLGERNTVFPAKAISLPAGLTFPLGEMTVGN
jgi:hypothetical protein